MDDHYSRRRFLASTAVVGAAALAGCSSGGGDGGGGGGGGEETTEAQTEQASDDSSGNVVTVGPGGQLAFEPDEITVSTGDTVTWEFASPSHNVCAYPEMNDKVSIPEGASGFGTMEQGGDAFALVSQGETFEHTFETPGEYTYVCVPHATSNMVGTVVVE
ncbi:MULTISPECIES: plastocyanin/azurin family copper-binding protein [Halobacterium]|uniref:plastocyanin/azurin family copper-binding protein n=1 Tax=Halobacterium TaxID=2239 RepID=UPI00073EE9BA|nr:MULTISPECIES: plastocyanin/azurin family copper-binding protein [Halobacterium]MCG1004573.1 plastocyanin/azurin family copper-binding protein [Halobacterium noricense]